MTMVVELKDGLFLCGELGLMSSTVNSTAHVELDGTRGYAFPMVC